MGVDPELERDLREAAFDFLDRRRTDLAETSAGLLRYDDVTDFTFAGQRIALRDRGRGIRWLPATGTALSFLTRYARDPSQRPYADEEGPDGFLRYKWQGTSAEAADNRSMRAALRSGLPLIWFFGVAPALYEAIYPVYLVAEEPEHRQFVVALDRYETIAWRDKGLYIEMGGRAYAERVTWQRLHQPLFRQRVLYAYERRCAVCRLRHPELLDAAHIKSDRQGGEPVVTNGIAMCKIHHAAFDQQILGIRPDLALQVRTDVLVEIDGPMLVHGLQAFHGQRLTVPTQRRAHPDPALVEQRWNLFKQAG